MVSVFYGCEACVVQKVMEVAFLLCKVRNME